MRRTRAPAALLWALALPFACAGPAIGASWPERPVRLVVPSVPGGGTDISMRIIAPKLAEILGQQVVIDNRGGAAGNIGAEHVAKTAPDGYTLLAVIASHTGNPYLMRKVSYDLDRDFAPAKTPAAIVNRVNREINAVLALPDLAASFKSRGMDLHPGSPADFARHLNAEVAMRAKIIQTTGVKAD